MQKLEQKLPEKLSKINELAVQAGDELGLIVLDTQIKQEGKKRVLEICVFTSDSAVSFADCQAMSHNFEHILEQDEALRAWAESAFLLEVVSPGIERRLTTAREFSPFSGKAIRVSTREKIGQLGTEIIGLLMGANEDSIVLSQANRLPEPNTQKSFQAKRKPAVALEDDLNIPFSSINSIHLWPNFSTTK